MCLWSAARMPRWGAVRRVGAGGRTRPEWLALTAEAYRNALTGVDAWPKLHTLLDGLDVTDVASLAQRAEEARRIVYDAAGSAALRRAVAAAYRTLELEYRTMSPSRSAAR